MSRLSQFLGKNEYIKERFLFESSAVWTVPATGEYRITALGGGGGVGRLSEKGAEGGSTIISMQSGVITLAGGEGGEGQNGDHAKRAIGGGVTSTVNGVYGRRGGNGAAFGTNIGEPGIGLARVHWTSSSSGVIIRGSGGGFYITSPGSYAWALGGGGGSAPLGHNSNGAGGAGGGIIENQAVFLTSGEVVTITIGRGYPHNGLVAIDRY